MPAPTRDYLEMVRPDAPSPNETTLNFAWIIGDESRVSWAVQQEITRLLAPPGGVAARPAPVNDTIGRPHWRWRMSASRAPLQSDEQARRQVVPLVDQQEAQRIYDPSIHRWALLGGLVGGLVPGWVGWATGAPSRSRDSGSGRSAGRLSVP